MAVKMAVINPDTGAVENTIIANPGFTLAGFTLVEFPDDAAVDTRYVWTGTVFELNAQEQAAEAAALAALEDEAWSA